MTRWNDTGLVCRLLGLSSPAKLEQGAFRGLAIENCAVEIKSSPTLNIDLLTGFR
ncbi:MAG TPA: hypothetical protein PKE12_15915 [Kiritimatiellia bacterium]|nr:hypothetical protein [Kiritimatiellia bacterium]